MTVAAREVDGATRRTPKVLMTGERTGHAEGIIEHRPVMLQQCRPTPPDGTRKKGYGLRPARGRDCQPEVRSVV